MSGFVLVGDEPVFVPQAVSNLIERLMTETADLQRTEGTKLRAGAEMYRQRQAKTLDDLSKAIAQAMVAYSNQQQENLRAEIDESLQGLLDARKALDMGIDMVQERIKALDKDRSKAECPSS